MATRLGLPFEVPDPANRCAALSEPVPQSLRQQELVCLTSGHVNCPRYMRGAMIAAKPLERVPAARIVTPAIAGSALALVGAFVLSVAFVVANGGLALTAASRRSDRGGPGRGRDRRADCHDRGFDTDRHRDRRADRGRGRDAEPDPDPDRRPDSHAEPDAEPRRLAQPDTDPGGDRCPDGQAVLQPVRAPEAMLRHAQVLRLRHPLGRQPVQHRQLLRGLPEDREGLEPLDGRRAQGRPRAADPATDPLRSTAGTPAAIAP